MFSFPFHLTIKVQGPTSPALRLPRDHGQSLRTEVRPPTLSGVKDKRKLQSTKHTTLPRATLHRVEGRRDWRTSVTTQEKYNHANLTSALETKQEAEGGDVVTGDTLVYTFDNSHSCGIGGTNHRGKQESATLSAATPPASARGAAAVDTKHPPFAERNHP